MLLPDQEDQEGPRRPTVQNIIELTIWLRQDRLRFIQRRHWSLV